jgi:hypothetical protein
MRGTARVALVLLLLLPATGPSAAAVRNMYGLTPLEVALHYSHIQVARHLLLGSTDELLAALSASRSTSLALPLYADLAASRPLTDEQWGQVPASCAPLARALPAVLARSRLKARLLMQRLVADQRQRLRTFALCLARAQRKARVPLPQDLTARLLGMAGADLW